MPPSPSATPSSPGGAGPGPVGRQEWSRLRWVLFCLVFYGIPVLLVTRGATLVWWKSEAQHRQALEQRLDRVLSRLEVYREPAAFFTPLFREMADQIGRTRRRTRAGWSGWRADLAAGLVRHVRQRFPGRLEFVFLDGAGRIVPGLSDGNPPRYALRRFHAAWHAARQGDLRPLKRGMGLFRAFLGCLVTTEIVNESLVVATYQNRRGCVMVTRIGSRSLMIVHCDQDLVFPLLPLVDRTSALNARGFSLRVGLVDSRPEVAQALVSVTEDFGIHAPDLSAALTEFVARPHLPAVIGRAIWAHRLLSPTARLIAVVPDFSAAFARGRRDRLLLWLMLLFTLATLLTLYIMAGRIDLYLSIKLKLVLLFLYTATLPLAVLAMQARDFLAERRATLEAQVYTDTEKALLGFDQNFPESIGQLQNRVTRVLGAPLASPTIDGMLPELQRRMRQIYEVEHTETCELVDEQGRERMAGVIVRTRKQSKIESLRGLTVNIMRSLNAESVDMQEVAMDQLTRMVSAFGNVDVEVLFAQMVSTLGKIGEFKFGTLESLLLSLPFQDHRGTSRYMAILGWSRHVRQRVYVDRNLELLAGRLPGTILHAVNRVDGNHSRPRRSPFQRILEPWLLRIRSQTQTVKGRVEGRDHALLITGLRGGQLAEYDLLAVSTDHAIRAELKALHWQLILWSLAMVMISFTVGSLLASKFLAPVACLSSGVEALRNRDFKCRLPVLDRDELGDLSATFNDMIAGLADLEVARIVQESLFPPPGHRLARLSAFGSCLPASQVGGDYYDHLDTPDGKLAVIVGDVSGHGVAAAMVMAMAKALVAHPANDFSPATVLRTLNRVFASTLKRRKMMTCFFAVVDPDTLVMRYANAGHNYPLLVREGGCRPLEQSSVPLGIRLRDTYCEATCQLRDGDRMVFYTDGLVEASTPSGEQLGFEALIAALPELIRAVPEATEQAIRAWHATVVRPGPREDDITLVILQIDDQPPARSDHG